MNRYWAVLCIPACLHHSSIEEALAYRIATKLASSEMSEQILREICDEAYAEDPNLAMAARADIVAVYERDPSCHRFLQPSFISRGSKRFRPIALPIGCGCRGAMIWRKCSKCAFPKCSVLISPGPKWDKGS